MSKREKPECDLQPNYKLWFEKDGEYIFGPGACAILQAIHEEGTITKGAEKLGMSYRYTWGVIRKIEKKLGKPVVETFKGGTIGGGGARVTELGLKLVESFKRLNSKFSELVDRSSALEL